MSDDVTDVLEEHERNEIRGTLLGVSRINTLRVAQRSVDIVDPYTREVRLWIRDTMKIPEIKSTMQERLGMMPMVETETSVSFEIKYGSKYSRIDFSVEPFAVEFKSV